MGYGGSGTVWPGFGLRVVDIKCWNVISDCGVVIAKGDAGEASEGQSREYGGSGSVEKGTLWGQPSTAGGGGAVG